MQIGEKIKNYRKTAGLTQEQMADYLDVSTPAVNKWEKGNTYPDISLLPSLARLLKIDMNELFSFREELTEKEIGQFVNELSEVSSDSFIKAFEMGKNKIKEYPHCDSLIYSIATVLNAALTLSDIDDEKKLECNNVIVEWLERTAESPDEKVRISSIFTKQLEALGVDVIEAGFPISSPGDFNSVIEISKAVTWPTICAQIGRASCRERV